MANKTYRDISLKVDSATGTLTEINTYINQASIQATLSLMEDTALGDDERSYLPDLAGATVTINGFINSTTDGIFGPLIGQRTTITKTVQYGNGVKFYYGEAFPNNVQTSGAVGSLLAFSADFTFDGGVTRTSVTQS
jgi:hypothetical protein